MDSEIYDALRLDLSAFQGPTGHLLIPVDLAVNVRNPGEELRSISTPLLSQATQAELFFAHPLTVVKDVPGWLKPIPDFV